MNTDNYVKQNKKKTHFEKISNTNFDCIFFLTPLGGYLNSWLAMN